MSVSLYNAERYYDPTAHAALSGIERAEKRTEDWAEHTRLVFICSPFAGDTARNAERARDYCRFAVREHRIPIAPHLIFPQFMEESDPAQRSRGIAYGLTLQSKCQEVWVFGNHITKGMALEIKAAKERSLPIRYFDRQCTEVVA